MRWLEENGVVLSNRPTPGGWIITWRPEHYSISTSTGGTDNIDATDALFHEVKDVLFRTAILIERGDL